MQVISQLSCLVGHLVGHLSIGMFSGTPCRSSLNCHVQWDTLQVVSQLACLEGHLVGHLSTGMFKRTPCRSSLNCHVQCDTLQVISQLACLVGHLVGRLSMSCLVRHLVESGSNYLFTFPNPPFLFPTSKNNLHPDNQNKIIYILIIRTK